MSANHPAIKFQADQHEIVRVEGFRTIEEYCLFLIHRKAYEVASNMTVNKTVLDLGCNNGYGTSLLNAGCKKVIGVDVSPKAIAEARRQFSPAGIEFRLVDGVRLPFANHSFEAVVSFQVIEHVSDYAVYLSEIKRVLVPGGLALFTTPNASIRLDPGMPPWNPFHTQEFTAAGLKNLLQSYFPQVTIDGLFAQEALYLIEFNRAQQLRDQARSWSRGLAVLRRLVGNRAYATLLHVARTNWKRVGGWIKPPKPIEAHQQYTTTDLFYSADNLEAALDLMALCRLSDTDLPTE
jgi:SAM-dependent methyltransferase